MRVLVFSDVHGNLSALENVLKAEHEINNYIFLGDAVNYGPWSNECVELIDTLPNCIKLLGNHEDSYIAGEYAGTHPVAQAFYQHCISDFNRIDLISAYQKEHTLGDWMFHHTIEDRYVYPDTPIKLEYNVMIGHSHIQFVKQSNNNILCNVGSVGQNRRWIDLVNYVILDIDSNSIECKTRTYDVDTLIKEMKEKNYPKICLDYYLNKNRANL